MLYFQGTHGQPSHRRPKPTHHTNRDLTLQAVNLLFTNLQPSACRPCTYLMPHPTLPNANPTSTSHKPYNVPTNSGVLFPKSIPIRIVYKPINYNNLTNDKRPTTQGPILQIPPKEDYRGPLYRKSFAFQSNGARAAHHALPSTEDAGVH